MQNIAEKYFEGLASEAEKKQLLEWLREKENRTAFNRFRLDWKKGLEHGQFPGGGEESWNRLQAQLWQRSFNRWQKSRKIQLFSRVAAIFFFLVSAGSIAFYLINKPQPVSEVYTSVVTENGQISKIELPDGSQVWLNSGSRLSYSNLFATENRNIQLTGEAYFDAVANETIPMMIKCGEVNVKVVGTRFNVNSYFPEKVVEVVLEEGAVELVNLKTDQSIHTLSPGERTKIDVQNNRFAIDEVNTSRYTSWREGIINIYNLPIEEVVKRLEKRYNQKFELEPEVRQLKYTFTIQNESLEDIIKLMEKITPVKAEQKEDTITIKADKRKMRETLR